MREFQYEKINFLSINVDIMIFFRNRDKDLLANAKDYDNYTLLQAAAFEGKSDVVDYLLGKGAGKNCRH